MLQETQEDEQDTHVFSLSIVNGAQTQEPADRRKEEDHTSDMWN
jgi:hypothetical protein